MQWFLATHNQHKLEEIQNFFSEKFSTNKLKIELLSLSQIGFEDEIPETGMTFSENSLIKAKAIFNKTGFNKTNLPILSDDSGLIVDILNGDPGVLSARYAGENATDTQNNQKLLINLKNESHRLASFVCVLCLLNYQKEPLFFEGRCFGHIEEEMVGSKGFGYDSLFVPNGYVKSFASLDSHIKQKISHRTNALKKLVQYLNNPNALLDRVMI